MPFLDLAEGVAELFEEAQGKTRSPIAYSSEGRDGRRRADLDDTWTGRSLAYRVEYHREMDELRLHRPRLIIAPVALPRLPYSMRPNLARWSPEDEATLLALYVEGESTALIAERLGRTLHATTCRAAMLLEGAGHDRIEIRRRRVARARGER